MKRRFCSFAVFFGVSALSWLLLSFYFFPLESASPAADFRAFFLASLTHMAALKALFSLLFAVFALFVLDRRREKRERGEKNGD
ncbi:MAG TPA: hypothetical protein IAC53_06895 [Candidatus Fimenecus excrementigallinarum]|uniref:Uncharacterized protein n=1 Tax=Candidatus Fimenecus excrementigallinarum TaxID=2840816 RepID=A0A9D1LE95_9FIRM|nr:hypothetical protein [Candidatus Fimenecus excrementigallinarum]